MNLRVHFNCCTLAGLLTASSLAHAPLPATASDRITFFHGMCDASAIVPLGRQYQLIADDEDNVLRLFDRQRGGRALWATDLSRFLQVDPQEPEVDLEAAARLGDRIYWISSHGRNRKGLPRPSRHRFFATAIVERGGLPTVEPIGRPVTTLLHHMLADPRLAPLGLPAASLRPPKASNALSIEGLVALPDGRLLLGFRNPQPFGKALIVPLDNPAEVIEGRPPRFGDPLLLDLGHRGIRGMGTHRDRVIIAAGAHDGAVRPLLFEWDPIRQTGPWPVPDLSLEEFNPESIEGLSEEQGEGLLLVSDDGAVRVGRTECKKLKDPALKRFRTLTLPHLQPTP
ncbi:MAG: DUF3616 domain-containing protein [Verrucomicrobiales bacterium]|nr:DUF3616 domain-containing protein [Verrucomicrobiales bacterium]